MLEREATQRTSILADELVKIDLRVGIFVMWSEQDARKLAPQCRRSAESAKNLRAQQYHGAVNEERSGVALLSRQEKQRSSA